MNNVLRYFKGHRLEINGDKNEFNVSCYRICDNQEIFNYIDKESIDLYECMNKIKIKISKIINEM